MNQEILERTERSAAWMTRSRTRALTAEDGGPPDRPCVVGELVWTSDLCDDRPCQCEWGFNGVATEGLTTIARVRSLPGVTRAEVRRTITRRMAEHGYPIAAANSRVDRLLDLAASLPDGALLRLEHGVPVPFPVGSRMHSSGTVISPAPGGER